MPSIISTKTSGGGGIAVTGDTSGVLQLASANGTTAVTVDASQNVGIGTASPSQLLTVNGRINFSTLSSVVNIDGIYSASGIGTVINTGSGNFLGFYNGTTQHALIDNNANFKFNSGYGSVATAYGCRAWVNFNGTGTVAIRASGNVSSITDGGIGIYSLNLTSSMPDANYSTIITSGSNSSSSFESNVNPSSTASTVNINSHDYGNSYVDNSLICVAVFR